MSMVFTPFYLPIAGLLALFIFSYMSLLPTTYKLTVLTMVYLFTILLPAEAYGEANPEAVFTMPIAQLPGSEGLSVGQRVYLRDNYGRPVPVLVTAKDATNITFDANHEMAGKELNFHIKLVEVK